MGGTILLADDSITIQKVVELTFAETDHRVVAVGSGRELFRKLADAKPDLVLCDVVMPDMNGYDICQSLKSEPATLHLPVILLTGTFEPFDRDRALAAGCDAIVTKPFEARDLISTVEDLLRRAGDQTGADSHLPVVGVPEGVPGLDFSNSGLDRIPPPAQPITEPDGGIELTASMRRDAYPASAPPPPPELKTVPDEPPEDTFVFAEEPAPEAVTVPEWGPQIVAASGATTPAHPAGAVNTVVPTDMAEEEFGFAEESALPGGEWGSGPTPMATAGPELHAAAQQAANEPASDDFSEPPAAPPPAPAPEVFLSEQSPPGTEALPQLGAAEAQAVAEPVVAPIATQPAPDVAGQAGQAVSEDSIAERVTQRVLAAMLAFTPAPGFSLEGLETEQVKGLAELLAPHLQATAPAPATAAISDEELDRIARRTLELATPLLDRIAWEIIPDMAEMLVRKRIAQIEAAAEQEV